MEQIITLYGKTYHFWQVDRGDTLPLGEPQLMMAFTKETKPSNWKELIKDRDERFGVDSQVKSEKRKHIPEPEIHPGMPAFSFGFAVCIRWGTIYLHSSSPLYRCGSPTYRIDK